MSDAAIAYFDEDGRAIFRCSAVNKCSKALVASLLGYDAQPPPPDMQKRFDLGHRFESELLDHVRGMGWETYNAQGAYDIPLGDKIIIRGHIDDLGTHPEHGMGLIEAKTMAPKSYDAWLKKKFDASDLTRHYADQTSLYWEAVQPAVLVMVVGRKETFVNDDGEEDTRIDAIDVSLFFERPASVARIKARLAKVLNQAKTNTLPETCDKNDYPCGVSYLHVDEKVVTRADGDGDVEFEEVADEYAQAAMLEAMAKKNKANARTRLVELLGDKTAKVSGKYAVELTDVARSSLDKAAVKQAGIDLTPYYVETFTPTISVKELA